MPEGIQLPSGVLISMLMGCRRGNRACGRDQRAWKQTKFAIALWKPSAPPLFGFHVSCAMPKVIFSAWTKGSLN